MTFDPGGPVMAPDFAFPRVHMPVLPHTITPSLADETALCLPCAAEWLATGQRAVLRQITTRSMRCAECNASTWPLPATTNHEGTTP